MNLYYYNWNKTLSYNAPVTMVISARGVGKTYGLRLACLYDYLNTGYRTVECVRYEKGLKQFKAKYYNRLAKHFNGIEFKVEGEYGYLRHEGNTEWELCTYFIALSQASKIKPNTYDEVRNIIMDEAVLEKDNQYDRYLSNEVYQFADVIDTTTREDPRNPNRIKPRAFLLGNALDLINPYFDHFNVDRIPKEGYNWYSDKTFLLHYYKDQAYGEAKRTQTLAGRILGSKGATSHFADFKTIQPEWIQEKTPESIFKVGWYWEGKPFGIWCDNSRSDLPSMWFINDYIPKNQRNFVLSTSDHKIDRVLLELNHPMMKHIKMLYQGGKVRFSTEILADQFLEMLDLV